MINRNTIKEISRILGVDVIIVERLSSIVSSVVLAMLKKKKNDPSGIETIDRYLESFKLQRFPEEKSSIIHLLLKKHFPNTSMQGLLENYGNRIALYVAQNFDVGRKTAFTLVSTLVILTFHSLVKIKQEKGIDQINQLLDEKGSNYILENLDYELSQLHYHGMKGKSLLNSLVNLLGDD